MVSGRSQATWIGRPAIEPAPIKGWQRTITVVANQRRDRLTPAVAQAISNPQRGHSWNVTTVLASKAHNERKIISVEVVNDVADKFALLRELLGASCQ